MSGPAAPARVKQIIRKAYRPRRRRSPRRLSGPAADLPEQEGELDEVSPGIEAEEVGAA
ncbi:hypothetical protein ACIPSA_27440 [Streptomyces sp. NPDC086549]|uniref:hypothetical protein n=1 Tax=Streptomyces sp. NPDC086549 TaxID=3365752 RepID=UPI00380DBA43